MLEHTLKAATLRYDLHSHSTASDGLLKPESLPAFMCDQGVSRLALTDHDTVAGLLAAGIAAAKLGIAFTPGIELSCRWQNRTIHIVGLGIDPGNNTLTQHIAGLQELREIRLQKIVTHLHKAGISIQRCDLDRQISEGLPTRTHIARALVAGGFAKNLVTAFRRFLLPGCPGHVRTEWPGLPDTLASIHSAGGIAVLAHPLRYKFSRTWMHRLLADFNAAGGNALEVVTAGQTTDQRTLAADYARQYELMGSAGSDFHAPEACWTLPRRLGKMPGGVVPVWESLPC